MDWYPVKPTQAQKRDANGQDHRAEPRAHVVVVGQQGTGPLHFPEPRGPWGRAVSPCMVPPAPEAQSEGQATAGPAPDGEQSAGSPPDRSDPCVSQLRCDVEKCAKRIALCVQRTEVRVVGQGPPPGHRRCTWLLVPLDFALV